MREPELQLSFTLDEVSDLVASLIAIDYICDNPPTWVYEMRPPTNQKEAVLLKSVAGFVQRGNGISVNRKLTEALLKLSPSTDLNKHQ